ncbi:iron transporter [Bifidobacterium cuniculi]|uniref:Putative pathogen-specific surface antigen n=1 Tax=Bifidobacterium cuniculi TaxID=1688 RepID=A0A087AZK1_9BIFI|nr:iron transporter [Bifidobacterium cuniculi]KFI64201.1 putative pathogen-specific surface antigen [Bifidobacterium cuniculi]
MKKNKLTALLAMLTVGVLAVSMSACGNSSADATSNAQDQTAGEVVETDEETEDASAGFEEIPIGTDQEVGPLNVAAVYFQPIDMEPAGMGLSAAESNLHLEADIHALKDNKLGYGEGDFIPKLTVDYVIQDKTDVLDTPLAFQPFQTPLSNRVPLNPPLISAETYSSGQRTDDPGLHGMSRTELLTQVSAQVVQCQ